MFDFHEKRKIRNILYSRWVAVVLLVVSGFLATAVYNRYTVAVEMRAKLEDKRAELQALEQRAHALESKVEYLERDRGIEEELRNRFDVVREGEQMVVLIGGAEEKEEGVAPQTRESEEGSFFVFFNFLNF